MIMKIAAREALRNQVKNFTVKNPTLKKSIIVEHFLKEGVARRTTYNILNKLQTDSPIKEKPRTGRPTTWSKGNEKKLKRLANNRLGVSLRKLGRKFQVSHTTIYRKLKKCKVQYRKRQKTPKYSPAQEKKSKKICRKLVNSLYGKNQSIILDDEKYFTFYCCKTPGNGGFYTDDIHECPDDVRFKGEEKRPKKILVWIAISEKGLSEPLIRESDAEAINQYTYLDLCLRKRLVPFINKFHSDGNYIFWPDLATSHYSNANIKWMEENINYVDKSLNPPNVPQARPIENFWGDLAQKVYDNGWEAKTEHQLKLRIRKKLSEFDSAYLQRLLKAVKAKLRNIADNGVFAEFKAMNIKDK